MLRLTIPLGALLVSLLAFSPPALAESTSLELKEGDRVAWIGGAFVERDQMYGYLETVLTAAQPQKNLTFRNVGWSGDTVEGAARGVFGGPNEGFQRLLKDLKDAKPTVIMVCYGANEAFAGPEGLPSFEAGYNRLLNEVIQATGARVALVTPHRHEFVDKRFPDPAIYNNKLPAYIAVIKKVANERSCALVDLSELVPAGEVAESERLTDNGVHFSEYGYWRVAPQIAKAMGVDVDTKKIAITDPRSKSSVPSTSPLEQMRRTINKKNEYWFHRHRPENETYLFLFRKHEQGNNAVEIPQFDPLIEAEENKINEIKTSLK